MYLLSGRINFSVSSHFANGRFVSIKKVASYTYQFFVMYEEYVAQLLTRVILGRRSISNVVISIPSVPPSFSGTRRLSVETYGLAHHPTSPVLRPDVPTAMEATTIRAVVGRFDSIKNIKGASVDESTRDESENILRRRKVEANGPLYTDLLAAVDTVVRSSTVEGWVENERRNTRHEPEARIS